MPFAAIGLIDAAKWWVGHIVHPAIICVSPFYSSCAQNSGLVVAFPPNDKISIGGTLILEAGNKALVVHRRLFEKDKSRYFIGSVDCCEDGLVRISGQSWAEDPFTGKMIKKEDIRTKIIGLQSPGVIVYLLPPTIQLVNLHFEKDGGKLLLSDNENNFHLDLSEMIHGK